MREWTERIRQDERAAGNRTVEAILPILDRWANHAHGSLTYRMTQLLTGQSCFEQYLHRIGWESTPRCHHCSAGMDSADHTVQKCPAWNDERRRLEEAIGKDLALPFIARSIVEDPGKWEAFSVFAKS